MMLNAIAKSRAFDFLGVIIVVGCAYLSGYMFETLNDVTHGGSWSLLVPFGLISAISSVISMYSDRLTARLNNLGNWIGLVSVILSGTIDYLLGNKGAIFTYPITFIIQGWAINTWIHSEAYKAKQPPQGAKRIFYTTLIIVVSLIFSYWVNAIGFTQANWLFYTTVIVFAFSLSANILNAMKLTMQWEFWSVYNVVQFFKSILQGNFANTGKYIYYIINSIAGLSFWKNSAN